MHVQTLIKKLHLRKIWPALLIILALPVLLIIYLNQLGRETISSETTATTTVASHTTALPPTPSPRPEPTATPLPEPTKTPTPSPASVRINEINLLTGQLLGQPVSDPVRPVAIMVNNIRKSLPQTGIAAADLIIEMEVESGVTRLLAVYNGAASVPVEVGSLRSARHSFVDLACGLDALLVHVGGSSFALNQIKSQQLVTIDMLQISSAFWRDQNWIDERGYTHSVKTSRERLQQVIENRNIDVSVEEPAPVFFFRHPEQFVPADGLAASAVQVPYSAYTKAAFHYDAETRTYAKEQFGGPHLDKATGEALRFTNVLLLQTSIKIISDHGHINADLTEGKGYYLSGGQVQAITWKKGGTFDPLQFFQEEGPPLLLNAGKSYIGIISTRQVITFPD